MDVHLIDLRIADRVSKLNRLYQEDLILHQDLVFLRGLVREIIDQGRDPLRDGLRRNYDDLFVSKSDDGKTFTIFYKESFDDGDSIQLALVCANGTVSSRALYIEKGFSSPERFTLLETDRAVKFDDAGNGEYLNDFGSANSTMGIMELRYNIRTELAGKYGLVFPDSVKKSDSNFKKALDANGDTIDARIDSEDKGAGTVDLIKKVTNSFFTK